MAFSISGSERKMRNINETSLKQKILPLEPFQHSIESYEKKKIMKKYRLLKWPLQFAWEWSEISKVSAYSLIYHLLMEQSKIVKA